MLCAQNTIFFIFFYLYNRDIAKRILLLSWKASRVMLLSDLRNNFIAEFTKRHIDHNIICGTTISNLVPFGNYGRSFFYVFEEPAATKTRK